MGPVGFPFVVLIERGFIVRDENEGPRNGKAGRKRQEISVVVPLVKVFFVFLPACNESSSILHHILSFVTINIHPIFFLFISPVQLFQPVAGRPFGDR